MKISQNNLKNFKKPRLYWFKGKIIEKISQNDIKKNHKKQRKQFKNNIKNILS